MTSSVDPVELGGNTGQQAKGGQDGATSQAGRNPGLWLLGTFAFSIPAALLYGLVLYDSSGLAIAVDPASDKSGAAVVELEVTADQSPLA